MVPPAFMVAVTGPLLLKLVSVHWIVMVPPRAEVVSSLRLRSRSGGATKGLVWPMLPEIEKGPMLPVQEIFPLEATDVNVVQVTPGVQAPPKVTVPVESTVTMLPSLSEIVRIGGVAAHSTPVIAANTSSTFVEVVI